MRPEDIILSILQKGEKNAIHLHELCKRSGLGNREARLAIESLRREGVVIISNGRGYYFPETIEEIRRYINQESKRAKSIFYTLKSARRLEAEMRGNNLKGGEQLGEAANDFC